VHHRVASASADQPAVDRDGEDEGDREGYGQAGPEENGGEACVHRAGDGQDDAVVDDLHREDAQGVGGQCDLQGLLERDAGAQHRADRQRVAEDEGQGDRQGDGRQVVPAERRTDHHAEDLADGTAGQAVDGGGDRLLGEGPAGRLDLVLMVRVRHLSAPR
jgi:hypothetical protein